MPSKYGVPNETILQAIMQLNSKEIQLFSISRLFKTPCFPAEAGPDYINAAVAIRTNLLPHEVLARLHALEAAFGRARTERWGTRPIDIDLIALDSEGQSEVRPDAQTQTHWRNLPLEVQKSKAPDGLILPHPRMQERAFVLAPLLDIAPGWRHPLIGQTVAELYAQLPQSARDEVRAL